MRRSATTLLFGVILAGAAILAALSIITATSSDLAETILAAYREDARYGGLSIDYPLDGTLFPPEIVAPTFRWQDQAQDADTWLVTVRFAGQQQRLNALCHDTRWTPSADQWAAIKDRSTAEAARVTVMGVNQGAPSEILSAASVSISTSTDEVGAPLLYREVILPFIDAVRDPSKIRWRFGEVSSPQPPPVVLENLPVCGNCHSFSADGTVLGLDVDYANSKGSYAILPVAEEMLLHTSKIITWDDYAREDGRLSFGLLSQVSPDGKYVVSTVKDRSVFVPKEGLDFSQLFFPIKGILAYYHRETKTFHALPGADDPRFVQSNPSWSPDGRYIVFARSEAYELKNFSDQTAVLLTPNECREFLDGHKTFKFDLYRIPFNNGKGGKAEPVPGANDSAMSNYFPRYSPDGKWIVFCRANSFMLLQPDSELYIIPAAGGEARRLQCNTARMNSWHSWSPNGRWLVFASKANTPYTQLMLTHIDEQGQSTPAVLLSQFTSADRAANIPEFVNVRPGAIKKIREQFLDDHSFLRAGNEYRRQHDVDGAAKAYAKALEINPDNADALCNLGTCLSDKGMFQEAETYIRKAAQLEPDSESIQVNLGVVLARLRKFDEALSCYRKALDINPEYVPGHVNLAAALAETGATDQAAEAYRKAISIEPRNARAHLALGLLLFRNNQLQEAEDCFIATIRIEPGIAEAHYYLGHVFHATGRINEAIASYRQAVELSPRLVPALNNLAWIYSTHPDAKIRNGPEALALAQRACQLTEEKAPLMLDTLAAAYAEVGDFQSAAQTAAKARALADAAGDSALAAQLDGRLQSYLAGKPIREASP